MNLGRIINTFFFFLRNYVKEGGRCCVFEEIAYYDFSCNFTVDLCGCALR